MNANWLAQLAPEHEPPPPPWWPPAIGWWVAGAGCLALLAACFFVWRWYAKHARGRRIRRAAILELERIRARGDDGRAARAIQRLLRRYALTLFGSDRVARLAGEPWIDFLTEHGGEGLAGDDGRALLDAAFGHASAAPELRERWLEAAATFIRRAQRAGGPEAHEP
ncbi:MAG TPA: DUF4381 domain-containing protein [Steroidobacteraceae bacterium]|nr:DUF4381 domain-containing protein [Steroidobacteraceae bacterium]